MPDEVAVFVDVENLRYGLLNQYGQEPDVNALVDKAKKYGRPTIMRAYADFTEHPEQLRRLLQIAGVEAINVPVKRSVYTSEGKQVERIKNAADMVLALDALMEALGTDEKNVVKTFLLVTGDRDYVKLVTLLRNRFGQRVVIAGVPRCIAADLVAAADAADPIEVVESPPVDTCQLKSAIVQMVFTGSPPFWTIRMIDQWAQDPRQAIAGTATERRKAIGELIDEGVLRREVVDHPKRGQITQAFLDEDKARSTGYLPSEG